MFSFSCDYKNGTHPQILKKFIETNNEITATYGFDSYSISAEEKIKKAVKKEDAQVYLLTGGTQTNQIVIDTALLAYEGVICATTGHINVHEAGAIEYTGHKVIEIESNQGKIKANDVDKYIKNFNNDPSRFHMVKPKMVYITQPTELGSLYKKKEIEDIYKVCKENDLVLYIDGARLSYGLNSKENDINLEDYANLCDIFYIGGTKLGLICGEAIVFCHSNMPENFQTMVKQHGAMLAKSRLVGLQFDEFFTNDLYMKVGKHAIEMAEKMIEILDEKGYEFFYKSPTNQQFIIVDDEKLKNPDLEDCFWEKYDENHTVIRLVTSWSTSEEDLEDLKKIL